MTLQDQRLVIIGGTLYVDRGKHRRGACATVL